MTDGKAQAPERIFVQSFEEEPANDYGQRVAFYTHEKMMDGDLEYTPSLALTEAREQNERLRSALERIEKHYDMDGEGNKTTEQLLKDWKGLALEMAVVAAAALTPVTVTPKTEGAKE